MDPTQNGARGVDDVVKSAGMFGAPTLVRIPNVEIVREASTLVWCRADGREFYVPREMLSGYDLRKVGDRGTLAVPDWFARDRGFGG